MQPPQAEPSAGGFFFVPIGPKALSPARHRLRNSAIPTLRVRQFPAVLLGPALLAHG